MLKHFKGATKMARMEHARDYRAVSGYLLTIGLLPAVQAILIAVLLHVVKNRLIITLQFSAVIYTTLTVMCTLTQLYKHKIANVSAVILLALLVM